MGSASRNKGLQKQLLAEKKGLHLFIAGRLVERIWLTEYKTKCVFFC